MLQMVMTGRLWTRPGLALAERPFQCPDPLCQLFFVSKSQLNRHTAKQCLGRPGSGAVVRNGKYIFICCGKEFASSQALGIHKSKVSH